ncbi:MAG: hydroxymethylglutaryl-CoA lyase [Bdellovibrionota bacterium]
MKTKVQLVEMGLRDGLQNEKVMLDVNQRCELALRLSTAGLKRIEVGAFVRPNWVPQMAGTADVIRQVQELVKSKKISRQVQFSVLVPNEKGMEYALMSKVSEIAIFASSSETFSQKNINCSIEESFQRFAPVVRLAKEHKIKVRSYLSVCFGCPYEGKISETKVVQLAKRMHRLGVYEISIGDTIGVAHPGQVKSLFQKLKKEIPVGKLVGHFHDTRGTALVNILTAYQLGVRVFDTSIGGLGGCPYAPGAAGNVATEDVVYMFDGLGVKTGVDLDKLIETNRWLSETMKKILPSKVGSVGRLIPKK